MACATCHMSMSLDGFVAGPDQSRDEPLGAGGLGLHTWHLRADEAGHEADIAARDEFATPSGACVMGRNISAGAIDELMLDIVPVLLGRGERVFDGLVDPGLEPLQVIHSPHPTHVRYRLEH